MSTNPDEAPPSYEEAIGSTPPTTLEYANEEPSTSGTAAGCVEDSSGQEKIEMEKAEEAGWKEDVLQPGNAGASGSQEEASSQEKGKQENVEPAGWRGNVLQPPDHSTVSGTGSLSTSPVMVLPPGLQPLLMLDVLILRGTYERGKGRRYRVANKNGEAVLYARSCRRGHHHPKDFQLYDSTRTAVVGQLTFSHAADKSLYGNLECPPRISLATIRVEDCLKPPETVQPNSNESTGGQCSGVKYTICNVLGQPVFTAFSSSIMNQDAQIKIYSAVSPGTSVADIWWDFDETMEGAEEAQSLFGEKEDALAERRVKITFPLDLEVKMKAALLAMCLLKDKIDHRMAKGSGLVSEAYRGGDVMGAAHHGRRKHYKH